ncbi:MAG: asparagine synthase (glutamine-hydrolyzing), partial [Betaproteobacteria bacterium]
MCGIAGKLLFNGGSVAREQVHRMCETLLHRGPDAEGIHVDPGVGLGQRRLSIIDLSDAADPPLANDDETLWIVFNGEIYNFRELRADLAARGHRFRTASDTEVLLRLYEQEGERCLARLRGMFAFAIWDARSQTLFAARDRLGKKPFVYARTPQAFVFGSEIKAIMSDPDMRAAPNFAAIDAYLTWQYVPSPMTAFEGVRKLPAAHFLRCDLKGNLDVQRYWSPPSEVPKTDRPEAEIQESIVAVLRDCVRARMVADVPLGALLSGGIDSGSVVALMAEASSRPVKTFSIGFDEDEYNELPYARMVAERYGTDHHEFVVRPSAIDILPQLVRHYNEPFADSS